MSCAAPAQLDRYQIVAEVKSKARALGFDLVGVAPAAPSAHRDYFRQWLEAGLAGEMTYLGDRFEERTDPGIYLPDARSVICVALNYHVPLSPPDAQSAVNAGRIARYALGDDYHALIKPRLYDLADWLRDLVPGTRTRCGVDTVPVLERELAAMAGIGWVGKNACVINPDIGSWLLLGEVLTTLDLPVDDPHLDHCGACRRCIDACPTHAITEPYRIDATRCISYLTIEQRRDAIHPSFHDAIGPWLYGCDVCQEVCPWNQRRLPVAADPGLQPRFAAGTLNVTEMLQWSQEDYLAALRGSAMKRVKLPVLQRNARIVAQNLAGTAGP